jgi:hypothetical protein
MEMQQFLIDPVAKAVTVAPDYDHADYRAMNVLIGCEWSESFRLYDLKSLLVVSERPAPGTATFRLIGFNGGLPIHGRGLVIHEEGAKPGQCITLDFLKRAVQFR